MAMILTHMLSPSALLIMWFQCQFRKLISSWHQPVHIQNISVFMQAVVQVVEQNE